MRAPAEKVAARLEELGRLAHAYSCTGCDGDNHFFEPPSPQLVAGREADLLHFVVKLVAEGHNVAKLAGDVTAYLGSEERRKVPVFYT